MIALEWSGENLSIAVESNSLEVIQLLNRDKTSLASFWALVEDIKFVENYVNIVPYCHIPKKDNKFIHPLAALTFSQGSLVWKDVFPYYILPIVHDEEVGSSAVLLVVLLIILLVVVVCVFDLKNF